jgi:flavorubredoxin
MAWEFGMQPVKILEGIYWVGVVDWDIRNFHGFTYSTRRGTTYNSYLIIDKKTALIDSVYRPFTGEMIERIKKIIDLSKIDFIIVNHVEKDHSSAISRILELAPKAKLIGTALCKEGLEKHYFGDWDFQIVKNGEEIVLGNRKLKFIHAPMLHWPDSMFTYIEKDGLLLPNDAFGQHLATSKRFDDEVDSNILMEEAAKYYAVILWPLSKLVIKKIEEIQQLGLKINIIAPSHGVIWRSDPIKIIKSYLKWAKGDSLDKILVVYDTMWGSTEKMARAIIEGINSKGIETVLFRLPYTDVSDIIKEFLEAKGLIVGSSTINNGILHTLAPFLEELHGLKPKKKIATAFGSYGWGGGAVNDIEEKFKKAGIDVVFPSLTVKWVPNNNEIKKCIEFGKNFAEKVIIG